MKTCVILFAGHVSEYAKRSIFNGKSAFEMSCEWATQVPDVEKVFIFANTELPKISVGNVDFEIIQEQTWTVISLITHMDAVLQKNSCTTAVFSWIDCPFLSISYTKELCQMHSENKAEYSFADGFPYGITPEIVDSGTVRILKNICDEKNKNAVVRDSLFTLLKTDINSFEIETFIAQKDLRSLRLSFNCATKRNTLLCSRMFALLEANPEKNLEDFCTVPEILHTLPSYYAIQIASACSSNCTYCPYPQLYKAKYGKTALEASCDGTGTFMSKKDFSKIIEKIFEYSNDAVISLSLWGEAMGHPNIEDFIEIVLSKKTLSLVIETCSFEISDEKIKKIHSIVEKYGNRDNGHKSIYWIVSVDAHSELMYKNLHNDGFSLAGAVKNVEKLRKYFPGTVYPQFMRLLENEDELESFYRFWKEQASGELIIQKYDAYAGILEEKKVADLSPVIRNPCWHLRSDMYIFIDGTVPLCRSVLPGSDSFILGNILQDSIDVIWEKSLQPLESHLKNDYSELCRKCDEYYTFNF